MLEAVLFDWSGTLMQFEWDDELLAAGHRAGLAAIGREGEADAFTRRFEAEKLPALRAPVAAAQLDYGAELRDLLGPVTDAELDRFVDAEHAVWRPARALVGGAQALLESLRDRGLKLAVVANTWPEPPRLVRRELEELGVAGRVDGIVLSGEVGARKPAPAIFERALQALDVDPLDVLHVADDRLVDDFLAFTPADVLIAARELLALE